MPQGLQIFGPDQTVWCDTNTRLGRVYGQATVGNEYPYNATFSELNGKGTPFAVVPSVQWSIFDAPDSTGGNYSMQAPIDCQMEFIDGINLRIWYAFNGYANPSAELFYGAF